MRGHQTRGYLGHTKNRSDTLSSKRDRNRNKNMPRAIKSKKNETLKTAAPNPANMNSRALIYITIRRSREIAIHRVA